MVLAVQTVPAERGTEAEAAQGLLTPVWSGERRGE